MVMIADGCRKADHYAKCGVTITQAYEELGDHPGSLKYFSIPSTEVEAITKERAQNHAQDHEDDESPCTTHLVCSRPSTTISQVDVLDVKCTVGACCVHSVPLKGLWISSQAHENFSMYDSLLLRAQNAGLELDGVIIDFNWGVARNCGHVLAHR